ACASTPACASAPERWRACKAASTPAPRGESRGVERSVTAVLGQDVVLPCRYRAQEGEQVVQVTWLKRGPAGHSAEVAVLNRQHGEHVQDAYAGRVLRRAPGALEDGAIVLRNAVQGDEGDYECHLITFPMGSFEGRLTLKVLVPPLPILNPGPPLEEGQGQTLAASCTAEGSPVPSVRWETEVRGTNTTRRSVHSRSASVTSEFFLVPGRSMNGKSLTCVVAHPGLRHEKRITHQLSVAYLSDASVLGHSEEWAEGMEGATLTCLGDGNPPPTYNWTRGSWGMEGAGVLKEGCTLGCPWGCVLGRGVLGCQGVRGSWVPVGPGIGVLLGCWVLLGAHGVLGYVLGVWVRGAPCVAVVVGGAGWGVGHRGPEGGPVLCPGVPHVVLQLEETLHLRAESRQGSLRGDSLEEAEGRSYSTLSTVREIETQTEVPAAPLLPAPEGKEPKEEEEDSGDNPIKQAMTHFVQENGMLQAKPTTNGIYINGRGHLV
uniref:Nectin-4 n=1 Tax=Anser cygnoides TaxID=8845 RepID=A0A8B9EHN1_ANSCY